jgi:hypothetical protein
VRSRSCVCLCVCVCKDKHTSRQYLVVLPLHQVVILQDRLRLDLDKLPAQVAIFLRSEDPLVLGALGVSTFILRLAVVDALFFFNVCVCVCVIFSVCVCMYVCDFSSRGGTLVLGTLGVCTFILRLAVINTLVKCVYVYIYIYMCVCVFMYVCRRGGWRVSWRERPRSLPRRQGHRKKKFKTHNHTHTHTHTHTNTHLEMRPIPCTIDHGAVRQEVKGTHVVCVCGCAPVVEELGVDFRLGEFGVDLLCVCVCVCVCVF